MNEKSGYKYSVKANQSLTSGTIGLEVYMASDDPAEIMKVDDKKKGIIVRLFENAEQQFREAGYIVAKDSPNNLKKGPSGSTGGNGKAVTPPAGGSHK